MHAGLVECLDVCEAPPKAANTVPEKNLKSFMLGLLPRALLDLEKDQLSQCLDNSGKAVMQFLFACTHKVTHAALYHPLHRKYKQAAKICKNLQSCVANSQIQQVFGI